MLIWNKLGISKSKRKENGEKQKKEKTEEKSKKTRVKRATKSSRQNNEQKKEGERITMKKRKFLGFLATALLCVLFTALSVQAAETTLKGKGTSADPYQISTGEELKQITSNADKYFELTSNITLSSWDSIETEFTGTFDGNSKTISGLTNPLFSNIGAKGTVNNLTIENAKIDLGSLNTGAICGDNRGTISHCKVEKSSISGAVCVGGISGSCGFSSEGGIIADCEVSNCTITGSTNVGGICGSLTYQGTEITKCTNSDGTVTGSSDVGGICGSNAKSITNCNNNSAVNGTNKKKNIGGICGSNTKSNSSIIGCVNSGTVNGEVMTTETGNSDNSFIGGVCGSNAGVITSSSSKAPETKPGTTTTPSTEKEPADQKPTDQNTTNQGTTTPDTTKPSTTPETTTPSTTPGTTTPSTTPESTTPSTTPESTTPDTTTPGTTTPTAPSDTTQPGATTPTETAPSVVTPNPTPETTPTVNVPAPAKVQKIAAGNTKKQAVVLTWKKNKDAKGYQIEYSLNKKFTKQKKVKNAKKTSVTIKKLKKGKTYFFRVRAFKVVNGEMICGKWSAVKKIRIKK